MKLQSFRLHCDRFAVEARVLRVNRRFVASVDTPAGPTLGCGTSAMAALWAALEPYDEVIVDLLSSLPTATPVRE